MIEILLIVIFGGLGLLFLIKPDNFLLPYVRGKVPLSLNMKTGEMKHAYMMERKGKIFTIRFARIMGFVFLIFAIWLMFFTSG